MDIRVVTLPSGAILKLQPAPFAEAKALYQALLKEAKAVKVGEDTEIGFDLLKNILCTSLSSPDIEKALAKCMKKALYNDLPMNDGTFEAVESRQDYVQVMFEVAKENVLPFFPKSLLSRLSDVVAKLEQKSPDQK